MKISEAFPDAPVIDLRVSKKDEPVPDPLEATITKEEAPKKRRKKKADDEPLG